MACAEATVSASGNITNKLNCIPSICARQSFSRFSLSNYWCTVCQAMPASPSIGLVRDA